MYLVVFTCLNIRAIHLELVPSLSVKDLLFAFVKFVNAHCHPTVIYTDNASNFLSAGRVLEKASLDDPLSLYLAKNCIKHNKIPLYSAWVGAAWERLIMVLTGVFLIRVSVVRSAMCSQFQTVNVSRRCRR